MKLFSHASEFDTRRDALSWALGFAAYEIKTLRRRRFRRREVDERPVATLMDPAPNPESRLITKDCAAAIEAALPGLPPSDIATLLAYATGEPPTDIPGATFRKRVERGLARLRDRLRVRHER
jgi:RNA polymerase sigma-70 factor (ECF subfamily)